jgi:hypothetical protein
MMVKRFLENCGVVEIIHPHCLPDLATVEFFLFSKVKAAIKEQFHPVQDINIKVTEELNAVFFGRI